MRLPLLSPSRSMLRRNALGPSYWVVALIVAGAALIPDGAQSQAVLGRAPVETVSLDPAVSVQNLMAERLAIDLAAIQAYRPGYKFWSHIFTIPDGSIAFGSAVDGRLLAVFPTRGQWTREGHWEEPAVARFVTSARLPSSLTPRRDEVARLLEPQVGPVVHNATRGMFVLPNVQRYGGFLDEWAAIYERFGVPAEIGLAQAMIESGFHPSIRSEARAIGFCQWLETNWNRIKSHTSIVIEGYNQTTQAMYCAAYLTALAAKYGSFIPALSEHHAGGTNVGRTVINGVRLGGEDVREQYLIGAEFARDLREISANRYRDVVRTYGPRSFRYTEMVFGNADRIVELRETLTQEKVFAMRATRSIPIEEVARRSGLSTREVQRFNPALIRQVPAGANLYLPRHIEEFGRDVAFWHRPADPEYATILNEFLRLGAPIDSWDEPSFEWVLRDYQTRFRATGSEEGEVMATMLGFVMDETFRSSRGRLLADFRTDERILQLFEEGVVERASLRESTPSLLAR